jgi:hypothetical protein
LIDEGIKAAHSYRAARVLVDWVDSSSGIHASLILMLLLLLLLLLLSKSLLILHPLQDIILPVTLVVVHVCLCYELGLTYLV